MCLYVCFGGREIGDGIKVIQHSLSSESTRRLVGVSSVGTICAHRRPSLFGIGSLFVERQCSFLSTFPPGIYDGQWLKTFSSTK